MELTEKKCVPCEGGVPRLGIPEIETFLKKVSGWAVTSDKVNKLHKSYKFDDFLSAMAFVDKMASIAEEEGHHPDFCVHYSQVDVTIWTHAISGLSENDFILAAKLDAVLS